MNPDILRLYLVTDSTGLPDNEFLDKVDEALTAGVTCLQLREKERTGRAYYELAGKLNEVAKKYGVPLLVDDRVDIALAVDAAGVHVGQEDMPVEAARALLGGGKIVGATAKTVPQAQAAAKAGADYLGVGAIYPTITKVKTVLTPVGTLRDITTTAGIPAIAIGGLNAGNMGILAGSGIAGVAVVSAIMKAPDTAGAVQGLLQRLDELGI